MKYLGRFRVAHVRSQVSKQRNYTAPATHLRGGYNAPIGVIGNCYEGKSTGMGGPVPPTVTTTILLWPLT